MALAQRSTMVVIPRNHSGIPGAGAHEVTRTGGTAAAAHRVGAPAATGARLVVCCAWVTRGGLMWIGAALLDWGCEGGGGVA